MARKSHTPREMVYMQLSAMQTGVDSALEAISRDIAAGQRPQELIDAIAARRENLKEMFTQKGGVCTDFASAAAADPALTQKCSGWSSDKLFEMMKRDVAKQLTVLRNVEDLKGNKVAPELLSDAIVRAFAGMDPDQSVDGDDILNTMQSVVDQFDLGAPDWNKFIFSELVRESIGLDGNPDTLGDEEVTSALRVIRGKLQEFAPTQASESVLVM